MAFYNSRELSSVTLPESLLAIDKNTFYGTGIADISISSTDISSPQLAASICSNGMKGATDASFKVATQEIKDALVKAGVPEDSQLVELGNGAISDGHMLAELMIPASADYTVAFASNTNAGEAMVTIAGIGDYDGAVAKTFTIAKAPQSISAKAKVVKKLKAKKKKLAKKTSIDLKGLAKVTAQTEVMYKKANKAGGKKITVNAKTGKVTVKKGLKKGAYKVKVKLTAAGDANHVAPAAKTVTLVVKVK